MEELYIALKCLDSSIENISIKIDKFNLIKHNLLRKLLVAPAEFDFCGPVPDLSINELIHNSFKIFFSFHHYFYFRVLFIYLFTYLFFRQGFM